MPLKRPDNYSAISGNQRFEKQVEDSESDNALETSSSSDSDSDAEVYKSKKPKFKLKPLKVLKSKTKKYDIWSNRVQEDVLLETLSSCDVTKKDRSRSIETYDYSLSYKYNECRTNNKRTRDDRTNTQVRPVKKVSDEIKAKTKPRRLLELTTNANSSNEDLAMEIANRLCEEKADLICK